MAIREKQTEFGYYLLGLFLVTGICMKREISRAITALVFCPSEKAKLIIEMCKQRNNSVREIALQCLADCGCIEAMYKVALVYKKNGDKVMFINYMKTSADADFMPAQ